MAARRLWGDGGGVGCGPAVGAGLWGAGRGRRSARESRPTLLLRPSAPQYILVQPYHALQWLGWRGR